MPLTAINAYKDDKEIKWHNTGVTINKHLQVFETRCINKHEYLLVAGGRGICTVTLIARLLAGISEQSLKLNSTSLQTTISIS